MSYGMRTWSSNGVIEMDTDSFTYQVIHNALYRLSLGGAITVPIAGFDPLKCAAAILPTQPAPSDAIYYAMPYQSVTNGSVTIRSMHPGEAPSSGKGTDIPFRLLVVRYKN